jgi:hypothetical protein
LEVREAIQEYSGQPLTKHVILDLLNEYRRPYDKINELVKQGILVLVKRGVYIPGPTLKIPRPEPFLLANHLYGPSYVSFESALSYHGFIPERVFEISSATILNSKKYKTPVGRFNYYHLPLPYYTFGIRQVELTMNQRILMASTEKALCDKIINTPGVLLRSSRQVKAWLFDDMRMSKEDILKLDYREISKWIKEAPKKSSIEMLVKTLTEL